MLNIVLYTPEIPENTGTIGRTCVATGTRLHLIEPLGFKLTAERIRRSGMDYWEKLDYVRYINYADFLEKNPGAVIYMASSKARHTYTEVSYKDGDYIMLGSEGGGIPEEILMANEERCIRIPMLEGTRCLNLSNSANVILYEALRQLGFPGLSGCGELDRHKWEEVL